MKKLRIASESVNHTGQANALDEAVRLAWDQVSAEKLGNPVRVGDLVSLIALNFRGAMGENGIAESGPAFSEDDLLESLMPPARQMKDGTRMELASCLFEDGLLSDEKAARLGGVEADAFKRYVAERAGVQEQELDGVFESLGRSLESAGITEEALQSALREARARVVTRHYPELAAEVQEEQEAEQH